MANTANLQILRSYTSPTPNTLLDGQLAYSFVSNTLYIGSNTGVITVGNPQTAIVANAAYAQANAATIIASAAFDKANTDNNQGNAAFIVANAAYLQANVATTIATASFNLGNTVNTKANAAFIVANAAYLQANNTDNYAHSAYNQANLTQNFAQSAYTSGNNTTILAQGAYTQANASYVTTNAAYIVANAAFASANNVAPQVQPAFNTANAAFVQANAAFTQANVTAGGLVTANTNIALLFAIDNAQNTYAQGAYGTANAAFAAANNVTPQIQPAFNTANAAFIQANAAFVQANSAVSNTVAIQGVDLTQNNNITIVQGGLNTANANISLLFAIDNAQNTYSQAAYTQANITAGGLISANANIALLFAIDNAQNTITQNAYNQANTAGNIANTALQNTASIVTAGNLTVANNLTVGNTITTSGSGGNISGANTVFANTFNAAVSYVFADGTTQITAAQPANYSNAAYAQANVTAGGLLSANANIALLFAIDNAINTYSQSAYSTANAAFTAANNANIVAQAAYTSSNTKFSSSGGTISGPVTISDTSASALVVGGSVIVNKDLNVTGNIIINGNTTTISTNNLSLNDSLIYLAANNTGNTLDIGLVGHFVGSKYQHTGVVRNHNNGGWTFFSNVSTEPTTVINWGEANLVYDWIQVGGIVSPTANINGIELGSYSSAAYAQANVTAGGLLSANANISLLQTYSNQANANIVSIQAYANTLLPNTGSLISVNSTSRLYVSNTTSSTSNTTGALTVAGGLGVSGNVYTQQIFTAGGVPGVYGDTNSAGTIAGNLYFNNAIKFVSSSGNQIWFNHPGNGWGTISVPAANTFGLSSTQQTTPSLMWGFQGSNTLGGFVVIPASSNLAIQNTSSSAVNVAGGIYVAGPGNFIGNGTLTINNGLPTTGNSGTIFLGDGSFTKTYGSSWTFSGGVTSPAFTTTGTGYQAQLGSNTQVSYGVVGVNGTGMYFPNSGVVALAANAANALFITAPSGGVNGIQINGSTTGNYPVITSQGTDANVWLTLQGKGNSGVQSNYYHRIGSGYVNFLQLAGSSTGNAPSIAVQGSDTNVGINFQAQGAGTVFFNTQSSGTLGTNTQFAITNTTSAVNYLQVSGNTTGNAPTITATGSDTNVGMYFNVQNSGVFTFGSSNQSSYINIYKIIPINEWQIIANNTSNLGLVSTGGGSINFWTASNSSKQVSITHTPLAVNILQFTGNTTGNAPTITAIGSDTNVSMNLVSQGANSAINLFAGNTFLQIQSNQANTVFGGMYIVGPTTSLGRTALRSSNALFLESNGSNPIFFNNYSTNAGGAGTDGSNQVQITGPSGAINYVSLSGNTAGLPPVLAASGQDTNVSLQIASKGNGAIQFVTANGIQAVVADTGFVQNRYVQLTGGQSGLNAPGIGTGGGSEAFDIFSNNNALRFWTSGKQVNPALQLTYVPSAVNYFVMSAGSAGNGLSLTANGTDSNINIYYQTKIGNHYFQTNGSTNTQFVIVNSSNVVNYLTATGSSTGNYSVLGVNGSDTAPNLRIQGSTGGQVDITRGYSSTLSGTIGIGPAGGQWGDASGAAFWRGIHYYSPNLFYGPNGNFPRISHFFEYDTLNSTGIGANAYRNYYTAVGNATIGNNYTYIISNNTGGNIDFKGSVAQYGNTAAPQDVSFRVIPANTFTNPGIHSNYLTVTGGTTGNSAIMSTGGYSDSSVSMVFTPKGNGSIDISTSGYLNLSSGTTIYSLVRSAAGTSYTSMPTITISNPTTPGVAATANAQLSLQTVVINAGGQNYNIGDVLTLVGGANTIAAQLTVTANGTGSTAGNVTAVSITTSGNYSVLPTTPISVTGGSGTGATFTSPTYTISTSGAIITNSGSGYVEQPTVTINGGGGSGGSYYAQVGLQAANVKSISNAVDFYTSGGRSLKITDSTNYLVNYWQLGGSASGVQVGLAAQGSDTNIGTNFTTKGNAAHVFTTNSYGSAQLVLSHTASAVNYVNVTGAATGIALTISAQGSDSSIPLAIQPKGSGYVNIGNQQANYFQLYSATAGNGPTFWTWGTDTDVPLNISTKGAGAFNFKTNTGANTQFAITNTTNAVNYVQATGAISGSLPSISAQGSDGAISLLLASKGGASTIFQNNGPGSATQFSVNYTSASVNYVQVTGGGTGVYPIFQSVGSDSSIGTVFVAKGAGRQLFYNNGGTSSLQVAIGYSAITAVNYLTLDGSTTSNGPTVGVQGSDTNIGIVLQPKGAGTVNVSSNVYVTSTAPQIGFYSTTSGRAGAIGLLDGYNLVFNGPGGGHILLNAFTGQNIGIKTSNPQYALDVNGTANVSGNLIVAANTALGSNATNVLANQSKITLQGVLQPYNSYGSDATLANTVLTMPDTATWTITSLNSGVVRNLLRKDIGGNLFLGDSYTGYWNSTIINAGVNGQIKFINGATANNTSYFDTNGTFFAATSAYVNNNLTVGGNLAVTGNITFSNTTINSVTINTTDQLIVTNTTPSLSTTTGSVIVYGGLGLAGNLSMNLASSPGITRLSLSQSNYIYAGDTGGNIVFSGSGYYYFNNSNNMYVQGPIIFRSTISNDNGNSGGNNTVVVAGTSPLSIQNTAPSTSNTTGALVINGGLGLSGNLSMNLASSGTGSNRLTLSALAYISTYDSVGNITFNGSGYLFNGPVLYVQNDLRIRGVATNDGGNNVILFGAVSPVKIQNTTASTNTTSGALIVAGGVGIAGALNATTKSFNIPHPTKEGKDLRYGSLEGPEFGVYVRGTLKGSDTIELPDYWTKLVDPDSITVSLTGIGKFQKLYVKEIKDNKIIIGDDGWFKKEINCYYTVFGERADVDKLEVES